MHSSRGAHNLAVQGGARGGLHHSAAWTRGGDGHHHWAGRWHGDYGGWGGGYGGRNDTYGGWEGDWCPDYDWGWHHHHLFFWDGAWVFGDYPCYGYAPGAYVTASTSPYPVNSTVISVQTALADAGYYDGAIDGVAGAATSEAIAQYQEDNGLPISGLIDDSLMQSLNVQS
ncbi:MAG TPA: peptidoglycan-binding protein [Verrucomicrobiaceae bacterium]